MRDVMKGLERVIDRRSALRWFGAGLVAVPALRLTGCDGSERIRQAADGDAADGTGDAADSVAAETSPETTNDAAEHQADAVETRQDDTATTPDGQLTGWATGGTAAMTAKATYPDPFGAGAGSSCELMCQTTIGPCHTTSPERVDVSDGWYGLPVRLSLRVVDTDCRPLAGAIVEIWHTNYKGVYSGRIATMCNSAEADRQAQYFRGYQVSDGDGRVDFDTCFPGWYPGRVVHIHFRVMTGAYDASDSAVASVVSQIFFSDELVTSIFASEPLYEAFGQPDTTIGTDNIIGREDDPSPYVLDVAPLSDGAMLASKTLIVRTDASALCTVGR